MLTDLEKKVIAIIQKDIPISRRPYQDIGEMLGVDEQTVLSVMQSLSERGFLRRYGATLRHQKSGFTANVMVAWQVDEACIHEVGAQMAEHEAISHCYRRNPDPNWPYNLYTMVHALDMDSFHEIADELVKNDGIRDYTMLLSKKELKKTSMVYFEDEFDEDQ